MPVPAEHQLQQIQSITLRKAFLSATLWQSRPHMGSFFQPTASKSSPNSMWTLPSALSEGSGLSPSPFQREMTSAKPLRFPGTCRSTSSVSHPPHNALLAFRTVASGSAVEKAWPGNRMITIEARDMCKHVPSRLLPQQPWNHTTPEPPCSSGQVPSFYSAQLVEPAVPAAQSWKSLPG